MPEDKRSITEPRATVHTPQPGTGESRREKERQWWFLRWRLCFRIPCFDLLFSLYLFDKLI